jgi:hypothetical protein
MGGVAVSAGKAILAERCLQVASLFDIWAMRDDGPPKMSSPKNDFASRNEVI